MDLGPSFWGNVQKHLRILAAHFCKDSKFELYLIMPDRHTTFLNLHRFFRYHGSKWNTVKSYLKKGRKA